MEEYQFIVASEIKANQINVVKLVSHCHISIKSVFQVFHFELGPHY